MPPNVNNVLVGTAQMYSAPWLNIGGVFIAPPRPPDTLAQGVSWGTGRSVSDGVTTLAGTTVTSATAAFTSADVGSIITAGADLPAGTYIESVTSATAVVVSAAATVAGTALVLTVTPPWVAMGATEDGVTMSVDNTLTDINIEEQLTPALVNITKADVSLACTAMEDTIANMQLAYGTGVISLTAPGLTQVGKTSLTLGDIPLLYGVGFEGVNSFGFWRRVYVPKVVSASGKVDTKYRRAAAARMYAVSFRALCDPSLIRIDDMTAVVT